MEGEVKRQQRGGFSTSYLDAGQDVSHDDLLTTVLREVLAELWTITGERRRQDDMNQTGPRVQKHFMFPPQEEDNSGSEQTSGLAMHRPLTLLAAAARTSASQSFRRFWKAGTRSFFVISGPTAFWSYGRREINTCHHPNKHVNDLTEKHMDWSWITPPAVHLSPTLNLGGNQTDVSIVWAITARDFEDILSLCFNSLCKFGELRPQKEAWRVSSLFLQSSTEDWYRASPHDAASVTWSTTPGNNHWMNYSCGWWGYTNWEWI